MKRVGLIALLGLVALGAGGCAESSPEYKPGEGVAPPPPPSGAKSTGNMPVK